MRSNDDGRNFIKNSMSRHLIIDFVIAIASQGSLPPPGVCLDYDIIINRRDHNRRELSLQLKERNIKNIFYCSSQSSKTSKHNQNV